MNLLRCLWLCSLLLTPSLRAASLEATPTPTPAAAAPAPAPTPSPTPAPRPPTAAEVAAFTSSMDLQALGADPSRCMPGFACFIAGDAWETGKGVARNDAVALRLYERGCEQRFAAACLNAGVLLASGNVGTPDFRVSLQRYTTACNLDPHVGCNDVAGRFLLGMGVDADLNAAGAAAQRGCLVGRNVLSCRLLARVLLAQGKGEAAQELFSRTCDAGVGESCADLGDLLTNANANQRAKVVYQRAMKLLEPVCYENRAPIECIRVAQLYYEGRGVPASPEKAAAAAAIACSSSKRYCFEKPSQ